MKESKTKELLAAWRPVRFARYEDGRRGPSHETLSAAQGCEAPIETLTNRRGVTSLGGVKYVRADKGCVVLVGDRAEEPTTKRGGKSHAHNRTLTADQVREIRRRVAAGELQSEVAKDFPINSSAMSQLARGTTYKWVT